MNKLIVSPSPHDENYVKTLRIMLNVIIALLPALGAGYISSDFESYSADCSL